MHLPTAFATVALLTVFTGAATAAPSAWSEGQQLPEPRQKHVIACTGAKANKTARAYLFGGSPGSGASASDTWVLNASVTPPVWQQLFPTNLIQPGRQASRIEYLKRDDALFVFGGRDAQTGAILGDVWTLDLVANRWTQASPVLSAATTLAIGHSRPQARFRHQSVVISDEEVVILFGTKEDGFLNDVWKYTHSLNQWSLLHPGTSIAVNPGTIEPDGPVPRSRFDPCCAYSHERKFTYCFGGTTAVGDSNEVWRFNHTAGNHTWSLMQVTYASDAPPARRLAMCALFYDPLTAKKQANFVIWAGYVSATGGYVSGNRVDILNVDTGVWTKVDNSASRTTQPVDRDGGQLCQLSPDDDDGQTDGLLLMGADSDGNVLNDAWRFDINNNRFSLLKATTLLPEARARHIVIARGTELFILFGQNRGGTLHDVWVYDTQADTYRQLPALPPPPSTGLVDAGAVFRGVAIWIVFGAKSLTDQTSLTNAVISFDVGTFEWREVYAINTPPARAGHGTAVTESGLIFVCGGYNTNGANLNDLWVFSSALHTWIEVVRRIDQGSVGVAFHPRRDFGFAVDPVSDNLVIVGGLTTVGGTIDRWVVRNISEGADQRWYATFTRAPSVIPADRAFLRGRFAFAGSGRHWIVLAGTTFGPLQLAQHSGFSPSRADESYEYNLVTGAHQSLDPVPVSVSSARAAYLGKKVYVFGGVLQSGGVVRPDSFVNNMQIYTVQSTFCAAGTSDDANCAMCSRGTVQPSCSLADVGRYAINPSVAPIPCLPGSFNPNVGASDSLACLPCPEGQYGPTAGLAACLPCQSGTLCPVGTISQGSENSNGTGAARDVISLGDSGEYVDVAAVTANGGTLIKDTQPDRFAPVQIPFLYITGLPSLAGFFILIVVIVFFINDRYLAAKWNFYLGPEGTERIHDLYYSMLESFKGEEEARGLSPGQIHRALDEAMSVLPLSIGDSDLSAEIQYRSAGKVLSELDRDGTRHLSSAQFVDAVCYFIEFQSEEYQENREKVKNGTATAAEAASLPLFVKDTMAEQLWRESNPDNERERNLVPFSEYTSCIGRRALNLTFSSLDSWGTAHDVTDIGEAPIPIRTHTGGVIWMLYAIAGLSLVAALSWQFIEDNITETVASVAEVLFQENVQALFFVEVISNGPSSIKDCLGDYASLENNTADWGPCDPNTIVGARGSGLPDNMRVVDGNITQRCKFSGDQTCHLQWVCQNCTLIAGGATVEFLYGGVGWFSSATRVIIQTTTGIRSQEAGGIGKVVLRSAPERSVVVADFVPVHGTIFKGYPASSLNVELTPTLFINKDLVKGSVQDTGYHSQGESIGVRGNMPTPKSLTHFTGVPLLINFNMAPTNLIVTRDLKSTPVDFLSAILGIPPGLSGLATLLVGIVDSFILWKRASARKSRLRAAQARSENREPGCCESSKWMQWAMMSPDEEETVPEAEIYQEVQEQTIQVWSRLMRAGVHRHLAKATVIACLETIYVANQKWSLRGAAKQFQPGFVQDLAPVDDNAPTVLDLLIKKRKRFLEKWNAAVQAAVDAQLRGEPSVTPSYLSLAGKEAFFIAVSKRLEIARSGESSLMFSKSPNPNPPVMAVVSVGDSDLGLDVLEEA